MNMLIEGAISEKIIEAASGSSLQGTGAQTLFIGRVRPDTTTNSEVEYIEFTAQNNIAEKSIQEIITESRDAFQILDAKVWHSLGNVPVNKACLLVVVNSKHRKESFQALEYVVNEVKKRCPIFGREFLRDGESQWKENIK